MVHWGGSTPQQIAILGFFRIPIFLRQIFGNSQLKGQTVLTANVDAVLKSNRPKKPGLVASKKNLGK